MIYKKYFKLPGSVCLLFIVFTGISVLFFTSEKAFSQGKNKNSYTIEQVMSAPFPSNLIASPHSSKLAWIQNEMGVRNIWIAEGPAYEGRMVTSYDSDDGQELLSIQFTPDEQKIIFVRGGNPNRSGEIPNPLSDPEGTSQAIWVIDINSGNPKKLADGSSPLVSPDGDFVIYIRMGQVWSVATNGNGKPEQVFKIRGRAGQLRWSPNGTKIAFVSSRGDHSYIGVYFYENKKISYLDPSVDNDRNPEWSPDGSKIAFMRIPNESELLPFQPYRSSLPWSIRVYDFNTEKGRQVWIADEGTGSAFRNISGRNQILWGDEDRIVFPWEKDGWTHMYSVDINKGNYQLLTPGEFEVQFVFLTPDKKEIIYSSNQGDIDRQHLWSVSVLGGKANQVTTGEGIEWAPVKTYPDGAIAFIGSGTQKPAQVSVIIDSEVPRLLVPGSLPENFPGQHLVKPEQIVFTATDGKIIHGQLFVPKDKNPEDKYPAVLFFHGGSRRQMLLGFHHRGYYHNAYAFNQYLANNGYIVLSVNYRSGIGYGMLFREAINYGARGASEFKDVLGAGLYLKGRNDVDPEHIGLWGGSYGGYLTALGLARASDLFAAGVDLHGVHDWNVVIRNFASTYDASERENVARLAFESSPLASVKDWRSPVLLIHGDDDRNVPFSETVDLVEALRKQGVEFEQLIFPDEVHGFLLHQHWIKAYKAAADFFNRKLKDK